MQIYASPSTKNMDIDFKNLEQNDGKRDFAQIIPGKLSLLA